MLDRDREHVLGTDHAAHVIEAIADQGEARVAGADRECLQLAGGGVHVDRHDLRARDQHIGGAALAELQGAREQQGQ